VEFSVWISQPRGLDYDPVTQSDPNSPLSTQLLNYNTGTQGENRARVGYVLSKNIGTIIGTWYKHDDGYNIVDSRPGEFVFGEILAHPLFAGYRNDGLADAYEAAAQTTLSELRVDFSRQVFKSRRVEASWFVGFRRVKYDRSQQAAYFGLNPDFPPLVPPLTNPRPDLNPNPDIVTMSSGYTGRGIEVGMDFLMPLFRDRIVLESGIAVAAMRSKLDSSYFSLTNFYRLREADGSETILTAPYDEFAVLLPNPNPGEPDIPLVNSINQLPFTIGQSISARSGSSSVIESYLGIRYRAWKSFEAFVGYRNTYYSDAALEIRPGSVTTPTGVQLVDGEFVGVNFENMDEIKRSVTYEGFYIGVSYSF
jgi:hypothetical protein